MTTRRQGAAQAAMKTGRGAGRGVATLAAAVWLGAAGAGLAAPSSAPAPAPRPGAAAGVAPAPVAAAVPGAQAHGVRIPAPRPGSAAPAAVSAAAPAAAAPAAPAAQGPAAPLDLAAVVNRALEKAEKAPAAAAPAPVPEGEIVRGARLPSPRPAGAHPASAPASGAARKPEGVPVPSARIPSARPADGAKGWDRTGFGLPDNVEHADVADDGPEIHPVAASLSSREVTEGARQGFPREGIAVIGIYGAPGQWRALMRFPAGGIDYVFPGQKIDGWTVARISGEEVELIQNGRSRAMRVPGR